MMTTNEGVPALESAPGAATAADGDDDGDVDLGPAEEA